MVIHWGFRSSVPAWRHGLAALLCGVALTARAPSGTIAWAAAVSPQDLFDPNHQKPISAKSDGSMISLTRVEQCSDCASGKRFVFALTNERTKVALEFSIANETEQVDEADFVSPSRAVVLGRVSANLSVVSVVDLDKAALLDAFFGYRPRLSPHRKLLAYIAFYPLTFPAGQWPSDRYMVYDLEKTARQNRDHLPPSPYNAGPQIYGHPLSPNGPGYVVVDNPALAHSMSSDTFFWLNGEDMLAFADQWKGMNDLVVVNLASGIRHPQLTVKPLTNLGVVDVGACQDFSESSFRVTDIKLLEDRPGYVRLHFSVFGQPCVARPTADIRIG